MLRRRRRTRGSKQIVTRAKAFFFPISGVEDDHYTDALLDPSFRIPRKLSLPLFLSFQIRRRAATPSSPCRVS